MERKIKFETSEELTSCFFNDTLTEEQRENAKKYKPEKWINLFPDKSVLESKNISDDKLNDMSIEELYLIIFLIYIYLEIFLHEEILNAEISKEKMKMQCKKSGSICIDTSKMEYVEGNIESNNQ